MAERIRTATVRGIPMQYDERGEGRPVLVIHGFGLDRHVSAHALEPIFAARPGAGAGWRRIYLDMPGHGGTPGPAWLTSEDEMLQVLEEFADAVAAGERLVVIGSSWGGYLAHALANRRAYRIDGLLLIVPLAHAERATRDLPLRTVLVEDPEAIADLQPDEETWLETYTVQDAAMLAKFRAVKDLQPPDEPFQERLGPQYALSFEAELTAPIAAPTLIVAGRQDAIVGYRDAWPLLDHLPRATFAVLDRAGHGLEDEQTTLFRALAHEWLDRVEEYVAQGRTDASAPSAG